MKLKLNIEDMTDGFFEDTRLMGIVAPVKDYQFCWQLNNRLRFDFRINNDIEIQLTKRQRKYFFGVYEYQENRKCATTLSIQQPIRRGVPPSGIQAPRLSYGC